MPKHISYNLKMPSLTMNFQFMLKNLVWPKEISPNDLHEENNTSKTITNRSSRDLVCRTGSSPAFEKFLNLSGIRAVDIKVERFGMSVLT